MSIGPWNAVKPSMLDACMLKRVQQRSCNLLTGMQIAQEFYGKNCE
jgi:hypothetical protein